jgi:GTP cyclohydrolase II
VRVNDLLFQIRQFYGGPLDLRKNGIENAWLYPIEIKTSPRSPYSLINFDLVYFGDPNNGLNIEVAELDLTPDDEFKLGLKPPPIRNSGALIRINPNQLYFPVFPDRRKKPNRKEFLRTVEALGSFLGFVITYQEEQIEQYLYWYHLITDRMVKVGNFLVRARKVGNFSVLDVLDEGLNDMFPYFQVFSRQRNLFEELNSNSNNVLPIRIDSGCQIGQIYDDGGCDCLDQFRRALGKGYLIFHLPIQDGRGWGMVTKMITEELKRNGSNTIEAARDFFGDIPYDIRYYTGVPRFLSSLGVSRVVLNTDNRRKSEVFRDFGIEVERCPTDTINYCSYDPNLLRHITAKFSTNDYY